MSNERNLGTIQLVNGDTLEWNFKRANGKLEIKPRYGIVNGQLSFFAVPLTVDIEWLEKELLWRFGKDAVVTGTIDNHGAYRVNTVS